MLVQIDVDTQQRTQFLSANRYIDLTKGAEVNAHKEIYIAFAIGLAARVGTK